MPWSEELELCVAKPKISEDLAPIYGLWFNPESDRRLQIIEKLDFHLNRQSYLAESVPSSTGGRQQYLGRN